MKFEVKVKQSWRESYFDTDSGKKVEYDNLNEIRGTFTDWEQVEAFVNNIFAGFNGATVEIKVVREA